MKRKRLKVVAGNVLDFFISRNNDIGGYWALGVLYRFAANHQIRTINLDLLRLTITPEHPELARCLDYPAMLFERVIINNGLTMSVVNQALIRIEFNVAYDAKLHKASYGYGDPFRCQLMVKDDQGNSRSVTIGGRCAPHSPSREHRSTRGEQGTSFRLVRSIY